MRQPWQKNFNPLSPHGERPEPCRVYKLAVGFQSTLPAWGETIPHDADHHPDHNFNPLSPHGERPTRCGKAPPPSGFQSTLPAWGETGPGGGLHAGRPISIHSPRMGRDSITQNYMLEDGAISIHSPRMGRDGGGSASGKFWSNISIHSPRMGRDAFTSIILTATVISIHSPRMGRDMPQTHQYYMHIADFNPLSPHGERLFNFRYASCFYIISIHSPRMGRDVCFGI